MKKKEIKDKVNKQYRLILDARVYLEDLKYFLSEKQTDEEMQLVSRSPLFARIHESFERHLILLYSHLLSKNDNLGLIKTFNILKDSRRNFDKWGFELQIGDVASMSMELDEIIKSEIIKTIRDKAVAHLQSWNSSIDLEKLENIQEFLERINERILGSVLIDPPIDVRNDFSLESHIKRHIELIMIETKHYQLIEKL